jgi:hypothetical protein
LEGQTNREAGMKSMMDYVFFAKWMDILQDKRTWEKVLHLIGEQGSETER